MEKILSHLEPKIVWEYFEEICQVPRPSKKEDKIIKFLLDFGKKHNLETKRDNIGNVLIKKPAAKGKENLKTVTLQSHMDMVCEKNSDTVHDFDNDPIVPYIDGEWVKAKDTTLGADDGIGIAAQMAVLTANNIEHGPIECLFTIDEETGLTGAFALEPNFLDGKILLNLDSEDEGELFIGCSGGIDTLATFFYKKKKVHKNLIAFKVSITGLKGGHSGDEINKGLGNSNKILNRFLWNSSNLFKIKLSYFDGGNLRNAIAREAFAIVTIKPKYKEEFIKYFELYSKDIKNELKVTEPGLALSIEETELPKFLINKKVQENLLNSLYACPHGVIEMSREIDGLVETSTNLASVKFIEGNKIFVTTSQRSSVDSAKYDIANMVESVFRLAGAKIKHSDGYPGWEPNTNSEILKISENAYIKLFNQKPVVRAIHAGLECGLFLEKYPDMDMISFGPTLRAVHSPDEKINIETVQKFWDLLIEILRNTPEN
ncbi:MAG: aminoacyl-histidine dipeptidase [Bacteroidales bacterium]|nr:aminoacyl-histidine dipeptidase [Bacteroidales bacterium]